MIYPRSDEDDARLTDVDRRVLVQERAAAVGLLEAAPDGVIYTDESGAITFWNKAAEAIFRIKHDEAQGHDVGRFLPTFATSNLDATETVEMRARRGDGSGILVELTFARGRGAVGRQTGIIVRDLSERNSARELTTYLSEFDGLTGLLNRATFTAGIAEALKNAPAFAVIKLALDKFKDVNAALGMSAGDKVLKHIASRISAKAPNAIVGRLAGDEFGLLLPTCKDAIIAFGIATEVLRSVNEPFYIEDDRLQLTASVGVYVNDGEMPAIEAGGVLECALLALQHAKAIGGNRCSLFEPALATQANARRQIDEELRIASEQEEFVLYFQPQFRLSDRKIVGAEALLRWKHPRLGILTPLGFITALEESANAGKVGRWIIEHAVEVAAELLRWGTPIRVGVNLFAAQLASGDLSKVVSAALAIHDLPPALLELEITESTVLKADDEVLGQLNAIRTLGVGLAFDDYGTGFASLSLLKRYPLTRIKIDRDFVHNLESSESDGTIVRAIVSMARGLGFHVTAEGIETLAQAEFLRTCGCDEAQGYFFAKPVTSSELARMIIGRTFGSAEH